MTEYFSRGSITLSIELHNAAISETERLDAVGGTEGFGATSLGAAIKDLSRAIVRTVGTNVRYWNSAFKRSELKHWHDGNESRLVLFVRDPGRAIPDIPVPTPDGMKVTYSDAVNELNRMDNDVAIINFISAAAVSLDPLLKGIEEGFPIDARKIVDEFKAKDISNDIAGVVKDCFSGRRHEAKTAHDVFPTKESLALSVDGALQFNDVYRKMINLSPAVEEINHRFDQLATMLEKKEVEFSKETLKALYSLASDVATYVDHFGVLAHEMQSVEHNLVLALQIIMRHA